MIILFVFLSLLIDVFVSTFIVSSFAWSNIVFIPMTSLLMLLFMMMNNPDEQVLWFGFMVGLIVDLMNHTPLFSQAIIYVLVLIILREYQRHFSDTLLEIVLMGIIIIFLKEMMLFVLLEFIQEINISVASWYMSRLFVTLIGNIPFILVAYWLANKLNKQIKRIETTKKRYETTLWGFLKD